MHPLVLFRKSLDDDHEADIAAKYLDVSYSRNDVQNNLVIGRYFRNCSESALICTKGKPKLKNMAQRNVALDPNLKHSQKPETLQDRLEIMYPGLNYLEMFARRDRPNWTCVGNECPSTMGADINDWIKNYLLT